MRAATAPRAALSPRAKRPVEVVFTCDANATVQPVKGSIIPFTATKEFSAGVEITVCGVLPPWAAEPPPKGHAVRVRFAAEGFLLKDERGDATFPLVIPPFAHCVATRDATQVWINGAWPTWTIKLVCNSADAARKLREQVGRVAFDVINWMHLDSSRHLHRTGLHEPQVAPREGVICAGYAISSHRSDLQGWTALRTPSDVAGDKVFRGGSAPPPHMEVFACSVAWLEIRVQGLGCTLHILNDHTPGGVQLTQFKWNTGAKFAVQFAHIVRLTDGTRDDPLYLAFRTDEEAALWIAIGNAATCGNHAELQRACAALAALAERRRDKAPAAKPSCYDVTDLDLSDLDDHINPTPLTVAFLGMMRHRSADTWNALQACHKENAKWRPPAEGSASGTTEYAPASATTVYAPASATTVYTPGGATTVYTPGGASSGGAGPQQMGRKKEPKFGDVPNWVPREGADYKALEARLWEEMCGIGDDQRDAWTATQPEPPVRRMGRAPETSNERCIVVYPEPFLPS